LGHHYLWHFFTVLGQLGGQKQTDALVFPCSTTDVLYVGAE